MLRRLGPAGFLFALIGVQLASASADELRVGGQDLILNPPGGYCFMDRSNQMDAFVMNAVEQPLDGQSKVLAHFVNCEELEKWHAGIASYSRYGNVASPYIDGEVRTIRGATRADVLAKFKEGIPSLDTKALNDLVAAMNDRSSVGAVKEAKLLGLVAEDTNAIYVAFVATLETMGERQVVAGVWAATFARSIILNIYLYRPLAPNAVDELLADLKPYLAALVQDNP